MIALLCFVVAVLVSPFKSKNRLEAENAALRHQLVVLQRKMQAPEMPVPPQIAAKSSDEVQPPRPGILAWHRV
jgi:hypothetical protein